MSFGQCRMSVSSRHQLRTSLHAHPFLLTNRQHLLTVLHFLINLSLRFVLHTHALTHPTPSFLCVFFSDIGVSGVRNQPRSSHRHSHRPHRCPMWPDSLQLPQTALPPQTPDGDKWEPPRHSLARRRGTESRNTTTMKLLKVAMRQWDRRSDVNPPPPPHCVGTHSSALFKRSPARPPPAPAHLHHLTYYILFVHHLLAVSDPTCATDVSSKHSIRDARGQRSRQHAWWRGRHRHCCCCCCCCCCCRHRERNDLAVATQIIVNHKRVSRARDHVVDTAVRVQALRHRGPQDTMLHHLHAIRVVC
jgi:hypothetical protein